MIDIVTTSRIAMEKTTIRLMRTDNALLINFGIRSIFGRKNTKKNDNCMNYWLKNTYFVYYFVTLQHKTKL